MLPISVSGRCYHHLGLFHFAIQYYKKVLSTPPSVPKEVQAQIDKMNKSLARNREKSGDVPSNQTKSTETPDAPNSCESSAAGEKTISPEEKTKNASEDNFPSPETPDIVQLTDIDFTHEAVFNMCQIYEACGSDHLARQLLYQYAVV